MAEDELRWPGEEPWPGIEEGAMPCFRQAVESVKAKLHECSSLSPTGGARELIEFFRRHGGVFLDLRCRPASDLSPYLDAEGGIFGANLQHSSLAVDEGTVFSRAIHGAPPEGEAAYGSLCFSQDNRSVLVSQRADHLNNFGIDSDVIALGLVNFALFANEHLQPRYGWVDEAGDLAPDDEAVAQGRLEFLFWANLFGPELTAQVGLDFFEAAPAGTLVRLNSGGVLYLCTESFLEWREGGQPEVLEHFRVRFPAIQRYRAVVLPT